MIIKLLFHNKGFITEKHNDGTIGRNYFKYDEKLEFVRWFDYWIEYNDEFGTLNTINPLMIEELTL